MDPSQDTMEEVQFNLPGASSASMEVQVGSSPVEPDSNPSSPEGVEADDEAEDVDGQLGELQRLALLADQTYEQINSVLAARVSDLDAPPTEPPRSAGDVDSGRATMEGGASGGSGKVWSGGKEAERGPRDPLARSTPKVGDGVKLRPRGGHIHWADDALGGSPHATPGSRTKDPEPWRPYEDPPPVKRPATPGRTLLKMRPGTEPLIRPGTHPYGRGTKSGTGFTPVGTVDQPLPGSLPGNLNPGAEKENDWVTDRGGDRGTLDAGETGRRYYETPIGPRPRSTEYGHSGHVPRTPESGPELSSRRRLTLVPGSDSMGTLPPSCSGRESVEQTGFKTKRPNKKAMKYDGKSSWLDYLRQFEIIAKLNGWTEEEKAMELATCLDGMARDVLTNLSMEECVDFGTLKQALRMRFEPEGLQEVHENDLRNRRRKRSESIPELLQDIKRLVKRAYPTATVETIQQMAKSAFITALNDEKQELFVKSRKPDTVDAAAQDALSYETHVAARAKPTKEFVRACADDGAGASKPEADLTTLMDKMETLLRTVQTPGKGPNKRHIPLEEVMCYHCRTKGHYQSHCPSRAAGEPKVPLVQRCSRVAPPWRCSMH